MLAKIQFRFPRIPLKLHRRIIARLEPMQYNSEAWSLRDTGPALIGVLAHWHLCLKFQ